jgi:hypothetical protein
MSAAIARSAVHRQLRSMGCGLFDLGVFRPDGRMLLREGWKSERVEAALNWLRRENVRGAHIFVRPHGVHSLSLIDDLNSEAIIRMIDDGFQPALVVETSPCNFQAWVNHGRVLSDRRLSTLVAKELAHRFGGDPSSADWRHFGRLAGFTNQKPKRRLENGLQPFVRLYECRGCIYPTAQEFLVEVKALADKAAAECLTQKKSQSNRNQNRIRPLMRFHHDPRYAADMHRADMAWAVHAASRGLSEDQIRNEILNGRDLSKKGRIQRQIDYAQRTAIKAVISART